MSMMPFYIYRHIRPDKNEVFYIGKGNDLSNSHSVRAYEKSSRNKIWNRIVVKNNGAYDVEIIYRCESEAEVNAKEIEFIALYGRINLGTGTLSNLTDGGDGSLGVKISDETRNKLSELWKGQKHPNYGKKLSEQTCKRKSESMKQSDKNLKGKKLPEWWRDKIRQTKFGENNPMFGRVSPRAKGVVDIITGKEYTSIKDAAIDTPYKFQYISAMLNGDKPNKTNLRYAKSV